MEIRICKYCNNEFKYQTHGAKIDAKRGHFCSRACFNLDVQKKKYEALPDVGYLTTIVLGIEGTVTLTKLSKETGVSKHRIRLAIGTEYIEWHTSVKGYYKSDTSFVHATEFKDKNRRIKECLCCKEVFEGHYNRKFCTMACKDKYDNSKIVRIDKCRVCGNDAQVSRGRQNSIPVCSQTCRAALLNKGMTAQRLFDIIEGLGIEGIRAYTTDALRNDRTGAMLKIDFYSRECNLAIEYHGEQHYISKPYFDKGGDLEERQYRDSLKREFLLTNGIEYVEWKYDTPVNEENVKKVFAKYLC